jgi:hypothetical protein
VKELNEVKTWEELGQWCWKQMLFLRRVWQIAPPFRGELPSPKFEKSIDSCIGSMLRDPADSLVVPEENKPWILARLQIGSGLLQPSNVRLLRLLKLPDPMDALRFLLLAEWYDSGREFWPLVCSAINEHKNDFSCEAGAPRREGNPDGHDVDRRQISFRPISSRQTPYGHSKVTPSRTRAHYCAA